MEPGTRVEILFRPEASWPEVGTFGVVAFVRRCYCEVIPDEPCDEIDPFDPSLPYLPNELRAV